MLQSAEEEMKNSFKSVDGCFLLSNTRFLTLGAVRAAMSTSWTCPALDKTAIREDIDGKNRSWYGTT
jgi:hypothetical protein